MSLKLKVLGLGLLAILATSAFAVTNVSATVTGHFTSEATEHHLILKGTDAFGSSHQLVFREEGKSGGISCTDAEYHGTVSGLSATTTQTIELTPTYTNCGTVEGGTWGEVIVDHSAGCGTNVYKFTSRTPNGHGTVHIECALTITHPNCEITIPKQTPTGGITYTTGVRNNKHDITGDVTVKSIIGQNHGGICIFLGTHHTFEMNGNTTVWGENTDGGAVGITAT